MSDYNSKESDWETDSVKSDEMENVEGTQYDANKEGSVGEDSDTIDSDYQPESGNSSPDDEEVVNLRKFAEMYNKKLKAMRLILQDPDANSVPIELIGHGDDSLNEIIDEPTYDSSEGYSYDDDSGEHNDHTVRRKSRWTRYDSNSAIPHFSVGMTFRGKEEMKKALLKYGIVTKRHIVFIKDERDKIRAPRCPWLIYGSKRSKCDWFQVGTLCDEHTCPPKEESTTYDHCMEPVEGEKWPTSDHPKPSQPGYVKMPGRPKGKARKREPGEKPKATKMSRVGTVMRCGLCHKTKHNSMGCPLNKESGKKKNALVTGANRKRKQPDGATSSTASHSLQGAGEGTIHRLGKTPVRSSKKVSLKGKPTGVAI
ncbi:Os03g0779400 [Oryza sativa Japonica Group]|nr:Os03g0779400 [Oryza sativa Japonica Group]